MTGPWAGHRFHKFWCRAKKVNFKARFYDKLPRINIVRGEVIKFLNKINIVLLFTFPLAARDLDGHSLDADALCHPLLLEQLSLGQQTTMDALNWYWDDALAHSLGQSMEVKSNRQGLLNVSVLDLKFQVKVTWQQNGSLEKVAVANPRVRARLRRLGIRLVKVTKPQEQYWELVQDNKAMGEKIPLMIFAIEQGVKRPQVSTGKLAVYVAFPGGMEKNSYDFQLRSKTGSKRLHSIAPRRRFSGMRRDIFSLPQETSRKKKGIKDILFKVAYGKKGRKNHVHSKILLEIKKVLTEINYQELLSDEKIMALTDQVVEAVEQQTNTFTTSVGHLSAVAATETVLTIIDQILPSIIADYVEDRDAALLKPSVDKLVLTLSGCLEKSVELANVKAAKRCIDKFIIQAPVDIGEKVFELKLADADMADKAPHALQRYRACLNERYYPHLMGDNQQVDGKKYNAFKQSTEPLNVVSACLYSSALDLIYLIENDVRKGNSNIIDRTLESMSKRYEYQFMLSEQDKLHAFAGAKKCLKSQGLIQEAPYHGRYLFDHLQKIDPDNFQNQFFTCINQIKKSVGESVVVNMVDDHLKKNNLPGGVRPLIKTRFMGAYRGCGARLENLIKEAQEKKPRERSEGKKPTTVNIEFNPAYCISYIMAEVPHQVLKSLGRREGLGQNVPPAGQCFAQLAGNIIANLERDVFADAQKTKQSAELAQRQRFLEREKQFVTCLKNPNDQKIAMRTLFSDLLQKTKISKDKKEQLIQMLVNGINQEMQDAVTLKDLPEKVDRYKQSAIVQGADFIMRAKIEQIVQSEDITKRESMIEHLIQHADEHLMQGKLNYRNRLKRVILSDHPSAVENTLEQMTIDALEVMTPEVIAMVVEDVRSPGFLDEPEDVESLQKQAQGHLSACLNGEESKKLSTFTLAEECTFKMEKILLKRLAPLKMRSILSLITSDQSLQERHILMMEKRFFACLSPQGVELERQQFGPRWKACLAVAGDRLARNILRDVRETNAKLFAPTDQTDLEFAQCLDNIELRVRKNLRLKAQVPAPDKLALYTQMVQEAEASTDQALELGIFWYFKQLKSCASSHALGGMLGEYVAKISLTKKSSPETLAVISEATKALAEVASFRNAQGDGLSLNFDRGKQGEPRAIIDMWQKIDPSLQDYLALIANYSPEQGVQGIATLKTQIIEELKAHEGSLKMSQLHKLLTNSKLSQLMIEAVISDEIKRSITDALSEYGISKSRQLHLSSPQMMKRIFQDSPQGNAAVIRVRREHILPLVSGELTAARPSQELQVALKTVLAKDDDLGGFVDTIFYDIIQNQLTDKRDQLSFGFTSWFKMTYLDWVKGFGLEDFQWGPPKNLRQTCGGRRAIKAFAKYIVYPMLVEGKQFSSQETAVISKTHISPHVKQALANPQKVRSYKQCLASVQGKTEQGSGDSDSQNSDLPSLRNLFNFF